jgi:hypothetical protein
MNEQRYRQSLSIVSGPIYNELITIGEIFFSKRIKWLFIIPIQKTYYRVVDFKNGEAGHIWSLDLLKGYNIIQI